MKLLAKPEFDSALVYEACISSVTNVDLALRFSDAKKDIIKIVSQYNSYATDCTLYLFAASKWGNDSQLVLNTITKKEFNDLYADNLVSSKKSGRKYYDQLLMSTPQGKCPYCWFGHASTLDHFLPKSRYPALSVVVNNLVPSCTDCNKGKGHSPLTANNQMPHPYFEDSAIESDTWLFAEVCQTTPVTVRYFIEPPVKWSANASLRLKNYFNDLDLAVRFSIEAASELTCIGDLLKYIPTVESKNQHLTRVANSERENRKNSWKAALYESLANSSWFLSS